MVTSSAADAATLQPHGHLISRRRSHLATAWSPHQPPTQSFCKRYQSYYPLDEVTIDGKVKDKKSGSLYGVLKNGAELLLTTTLPISGADSLVTSEYSSIELDGEGRKQAIMRRFYAHAAGGEVQLLPEKRVEELTFSSRKALPSPRSRISGVVSSVCWDVTWMPFHSV